MKSWQKILSAAIIIMLLISLTACLGLRPSKEYYVNDFANVFLEGTRDTIVLESARLYETTKKGEHGGTKLIVVTNLFENIEDIKEEEAKELFESWALGEGDIMVYFAFVEGASEQIQLISVLLKIGDEMERHISTEDAVNMVESTLFNPIWEGNLNLGMGHFYYELLSAIYKRAYSYTTFDYDLDAYEEYIDSSGVIGKQKPMSAMGYIFSSYSPAWKKIVVIGPIILFVVGLFFLLRARRKL